MGLRLTLRATDNR